MMASYELLDYESVACAHRETGQIKANTFLMDFHVDTFLSSAL